MKSEPEAKLTSYQNVPYTLELCWRLKTHNSESTASSCSVNIRADWCFLMCAQEEVTGLHLKDMVYNTHRPRSSPRGTIMQSRGG